MQNLKRLKAKEPTIVMALGFTKALDKQFTGIGVQLTDQPVMWVKQVYKCGQAECVVTPKIGSVRRLWWKFLGKFRRKSNLCGDKEGCSVCYPGEAYYRL